MRLAVTISALALGAGGLGVNVLPRPAFPGPVTGPHGPHRLAIVSSRYLAPGNLENDGVTAPASVFRGLPGQLEFFTANRVFDV